MPLVSSFFRYDPKFGKKHSHLLQIHPKSPLGQSSIEPPFCRPKKIGSRTQRHPNSTRYAPMCSSEPAEKSLPRLDDFPKGLHREMAWGNCDPSWDEHEHEHELSLAWSKTQSSSNVNHITLRCHQTWFAWKSIIYRWFSHWHLHFYCKLWYKNIQHLSSSASIDTSKACLEEYLLCPRCGQGLIIGLPSAFLSRKKDVPTSYSGCWKLVNLRKSLDFFKWTEVDLFQELFSVHLILNFQKSMEISVDLDAWSPKRTSFIIIRWDKNVLHGSFYPWVTWCSPQFF